MARKRLPFTQSDIECAIRGILASGLSIRGVKINTTVDVSFVTAESDDDAVADKSDWDFLRGDDEAER